MRLIQVECSQSKLCKSICIILNFLFNKLFRQQEKFVKHLYLTLGPYLFLFYYLSRPYISTISRFSRLSVKFKNRFNFLFIYKFSCSYIACLNKIMYLVISKKKVSNILVKSLFFGLKYGTLNKIDFEQFVNYD